jgi:hypothetical protein
MPRSAVIMVMEAVRFYVVRLQCIHRKEGRMLHRNSAKRGYRFAVVALAAGIMLFLGSLSAVAATAPGRSGATTTTVNGASGHIAVPSYYITPTGERLSAAEVDTGAASSAAAAASVPVFHITDSNYGTLTGIHKCEVIGTYHSGSLQAVDCADLYAIPDDIDPNGGDGPYIDVYPATEAYCQGSGGYTRCSGVFLYAQLEIAQSPGKATEASVDDAGCQYPGLSTAACAGNGRNYWTDDAGSTYESLSYNCNTTPGQGFEFWTTIIYANISSVANDGTFGGPHAIICGA